MRNIAIWRGFLFFFVILLSHYSALSLKQFSSDVYRFIHEWLVCFIIRFRLRGLIVFVALLLGISFTTTAVIYAHYDLPAVIISKAALDAAWEPIFLPFCLRFLCFDCLFACFFLVLLWQRAEAQTCYQTVEKKRKSRCPSLVLTLSYVNDFFCRGRGADSMSLTYVKPYCRISPYLVGIVTGYLLLHVKDWRLSTKVWNYGDHIFSHKCWLTFLLELVFVGGGSPFLPAKSSLQGAKDYTWG